MRKLVLFAFCLAFFFGQALSGYASNLSKFKRLVVFGDSLSDNGNSLVLFKLPLPPYYDGRWSNGPNWVDYFPSVAHHFPTVAAHFADPASRNGTNFAVGGAISEDLSAQIREFLASTGGLASADDLYVIWIGANDFAAGVSPSMTAEHIRSGIIRLRQAGARAFVVITVPDISLTPTVIAAGVFQEAKLFVFAVNSLLEAEILPLGWSPGTKIDLVDINLIFTQLVLNPARFGFSNSTGAAFTPPSNLVSDPNDYVFWDGFHPTTKVHRIAAEYIYRTLARVSREDLPVRLARP
jgi:outer membrane lipase/esterase